MKRHLDEKLSGHFKKYRQVLILLGSRQVGKTTIAKKIFPEADYLLVDNEPIRKILETYDINAYKTLLSVKAKTIVIDEIHLLKDPGRAVKIFFDQISDLQIVITGSSSFHIKNRTGESLAGRKIDYQIYPLSFSEYLQQKGLEADLNCQILENAVSLSEAIFSKRFYKFDMAAILEEVLLFGLYPHFVENPRDAKYLENFVDSLVYKDLLELKLIEDRRLAANLLKLLAFQAGNIINYSELASSLKADHRTIRRYIEIFEQSFILFRLFPYTKNQRNEIVKSAKIYFLDTGLRNALIGDFSPLATRTDKGALFENFIINEVVKQNDYFDKGYKFNYWRTRQGSVVDLVLSRGNDLLGLEVKYGKGAISKAFLNFYPSARLKLLNSENFY